MARLNQDNLLRARSLIALYPHKRSALVPLLHLVQEQEGYLSPEGIEHIAELLDLTAAEVRGTASFYDMFHLEPIGRYLVAVCTNIACMLAGAYELLEHISQTLGIHPGGTTDDDMFTLEDAECLALCGNAPCVTVNWRFFGDMTTDRWDALAEDLRGGRLDGEVPPHGTLCRVKRTVGLLAPADGGAAYAPGIGGSRGQSGSTQSQKGRRARGRPQPAEGGGPAPAPAATREGAKRDGVVDLTTSRTTPAVASTVAPGAGRRGGDGQSDHGEDTVKHRREVRQ